MSSSLSSPPAGFTENLRQSLVSKRIPIRREVALRFPHLPGVVTGMCWNISMTGMFVRSRDLAIPGAAVSFELPAAGSAAIRGQAEVAWVRERDDGADRPRGLGLRFVRLNQGSPLYIRRAVEKRILKDGTLSELDELMSASEESVDRALAGQLWNEPEARAAGAIGGAPRPAPAVDPRRLYPYAGSAAARPQPLWRSYRSAALGLVLLAALVIAGLVVLL